MLLHGRPSRLRHFAKDYLNVNVNRHGHKGLRAIRLTTHSKFNRVDCVKIKLQFHAVFSI